VDRCSRERWVGCEAAFAGKPGSYSGSVQPWEMGWLWGRLRRQAWLLQWIGAAV